MIEHNEIVKLADKEYPIRCDINVLIEIQEQFGNLTEFEMQIAGIKIVKNTDGSIILCVGSETSVFVDNIFIKDKAPITIDEIKAYNANLWKRVEVFTYVDHKIFLSNTIKRISGSRP